MRSAADGDTLARMRPVALVRRVGGFLVTVHLALFGHPALADEPAPATDQMRTIGVGTGGGYSWIALAGTAGQSSSSATTSGATYPPLELQFFNDKGGSFDLSIPVGAIVYAAANQGTTVGASLFYSPQYSSGSVRGVFSPGLGWGYSSQGGVSAQITESNS